MTYHIALVSSSRDIDAASVESIDKGNGVRIRYGVRHGSQTREAFAYELDGAVFAEGAARAYMQGRGIDVVEFRAAAAPKGEAIVEIECEVARVGKWRPNVFDGKGDPVEDAEIEFTAEMFAQMVETFAGAAPFKLGHYDQAGAREMFAEGDHPMGAIHSLRVDGDALVAKAKVPQSVKDAIGAKLLLQRSIEATKRAGKWFLDAVAWLKNSPPAVQGMPDAQVSASIFASARLVLADAVTPPGGPDVQDGENKESTGTTPGDTKEPDPEEGEETDTMSEELKAQNQQLLASYRAQAGRIVDGLVGRKLTPAQGESAKKLLANMETVGAIDAQVEFLASGADIPSLTGQVGNGRSPQETEDTTKAKPQTITEKIMACVRDVRTQNPKLSEWEAARLVASANPELAAEWEAESGLTIKGRA